MDQPGNSPKLHTWSGYAEKPEKNITQLRELQEKLSRLFESATDGILILDLNGIIREINPRVREVLGRPGEDIIGRSFFDFISPQDKLLFENAWNLLKQKGIFQRLEFRVLKEDGSLIWGEENASVLKDEYGNPRGYLVIARDITDRKLAEEKLRQSDLEFRKLFEAMAEGVALIDASGKVVRANSTEAAILGLDSDRTRTGQPFRCPTCGYFKADGSPLPLEEMATYLGLKKKRRMTNSEIQIVRPDGSAVWCNMQAVPIVNGFGNITGAVQTLIEITEQKKLKDEKEKYLEDITRVQEEERKRLSRELHDETAQSLSLLILELDAIYQKKYRMNKDILTKLEKLRDTAQHTLNEVRRYSHELRPSILDNLGLMAAVEALADDLNREQRIKCIVNVSGEVVRMTNEVELALFRIVQEALTNIRKHSEATKASVNLRFSPGKVRLGIIDNGKGFDIQGIQSFSEAGHLGLVGMKERASLIKGNLQIKSAIGAGTRISIEVPLVN